MLLLNILFTDQIVQKRLMYSNTVTYRQAEYKTRSIGINKYGQRMSPSDGAGMR